MSSGNEVFTRLFLFFSSQDEISPSLSSRDEISSRPKRVNSKRHFTIDRDDFIRGRVSSRDEISRVNTLLRDQINVYNCPSRYLFVEMH